MTTNVTYALKAAEWFLLDLFISQI